MYSTGGERLVLLVEDSKEDERLTCRALEQMGVPVKIDIVRDGEEAVSYLSSSKCIRKAPDLILLDIKLPKYSGHEVLEHVRKAVHLDQVPVVMLTSSDDQTDIRRSYSMGANGYVRKAMDFDKYMEEIRITALYWTSINIPMRQKA